MEVIYPKRSLLFCFFVVGLLACSIDDAWCHSKKRKELMQHNNKIAGSSGKSEETDYGTQTITRNLGGELDYDTGSNESSIEKWRPYQGSDKLDKHLSLTKEEMVYLVEKIGNLTSYVNNNPMKYLELALSLKEYEKAKKDYKNLKEAYDKNVTKRKYKYKKEINSHKITKISTEESVKLFACFAGMLVILFPSLFVCKKLTD